MANAVSTEEIKEVLGGFLVVGPSMRPDPVAQVLDWQLGEVVAAIDCNMRELVRLGGKMDGFAWEMQRLANQGDRKGKGKAQPETEDEERSDDREDKGEVDDLSDEDAEGEDVEGEDMEGKDAEE